VKLYFFFVKVVITIVFVLEICMHQDYCEQHTWSRGSNLFSENEDEMGPSFHLHFQKMIGTSFLYSNWNLWCIKFWKQVWVWNSILYSKDGLTVFFFSVSIF